MLINLRNALMTGRRLPYDAEVEYLRMSDGQYAIIDYTPTHDTSCDVFIRPIVLNPKNGSRGLFGSEDANDVHSFMAQYENDQWATNLLQFRFGGYLNSKQVAQFNVGSVYEITLNKNGGFVNGARVVPVKTSSPSGSSQTTFGVGCYIRGGNVVGYAGVYDYFGLKIVENSILVRDFIPVRVGTVGYLYDRVSGKLFGNAGTGDFVLGADKARFGLP